MRSGHLLVLLTALVEASIAIEGCGCPSAGVSASNPLASPPTFASASAWSDVCDAACAPAAAQRPCRISVVPTSQRSPGTPYATVTCVGADGRGVSASLAGDWPSVCSDRCGFSDWTTCTLDSGRGVADCSKPGCTGGAGRRPEGFIPGRSIGSCELGAHFARMAELEAVSVVAFGRLAEDLARLGAPTELIARARGAGSDEVRHAARVGAIARRFGGRTSRSRVRSRRRPCTLRELAVENAREGCVAETFGVALALLQARTTKDAEVRRELTAIAQDEARHAELAWDVARWAGPQLDAEGRDEVRRALRDAGASLTSGSGAPCATRSSTLHTIAGLPTRAMASRLVRGFCEALGLAREDGSLE